MGYPFSLSLNSLKVIIKPYIFMCKIQDSGLFFFFFDILNSWRFKNAEDGTL